MNGVIYDAKVAHKRKVKVNPIAHHYEKPGEQPYIKYNCPVCDAVGNKHISVPHGTSHCPLCGVALNWDRKPEIGDTVTMLATKLTESIFPKGDICVITECGSDGSFYLEQQADHLSYSVDGYHLADTFSILEESEDD